MERGLRARPPAAKVSERMTSIEVRRTRPELVPDPGMTRPRTQKHVEEESCRLSEL